MGGASTRDGGPVADRRWSPLPNALSSAGVSGREGPSERKSGTKTDQGTFEDAVAVAWVEQGKVHAFQEPPLQLDETPDTTDNDAATAIS